VMVERRSSWILAEYGSRTGRGRAEHHAPGQGERRRGSRAVAGMMLRPQELGVLATVGRTSEE